MVDYSDAWFKKVKINIPGNIDDIVTDTSIPVKIFWNPQIQLDFRDIRFSSVGLTPTSFDYCIVDKVDGSYANVLVKIPSLPQYPDSLDMNIYWSNPLAISESDPDNIYLLYDDFEEELLDSTKWNLDGGHISILDSIATITNSLGDWLNLSSKEIDFTDNIDIEIRIKKTDNDLRVGLTSQYNLADGSVILLYKGTGELGILSCVDNVCDQSIIFPHNLNSFHIINLKVSNGNVEGFYDGISQGESSTDIPIPPYRFMLANNNSICEVDYIKILKTTPNPPAPIIIGSGYIELSSSIEDVNGNTINNLFFETGYPGSANTKMVQLVIGSFGARNIKINCVDVNPNIIPSSMRNSSINSSSYMEISIDNINFYPILYINTIPPNSIQDLFIKCTVPQNVIGGTFMCGLNVELEM